jgi:tetratricopeptide (TPR) repeat protein
MLRGQLGQAELAAEHWRRALAHTENNLVNLRRFAELAYLVNAQDQAILAYTRLSQVTVDRLRALRRLVQLHEARGESELARGVMREWSNDIPDDPIPANGFAYLSALLGKDLDLAQARSEEIVQRFPDRIGYRITLALILLRQQQHLEALEQFSRVRPEFDLGLPYWRVVYAAVLEANGRIDEARALVQDLEPRQLRPEERELLRRVRGEAAAPAGA